MTYTKQSDQSDMPQTILSGNISTPYQQTNQGWMCHLLSWPQKKEKSIRRSFNNSLKEIKKTLMYLLLTISWKRNDPETTFSSTSWHFQLIMDCELWTVKCVILISQTKFNPDCELWLCNCELWMVKYELWSLWLYIHHILFSIHGSCKTN